MKYKYDQGGEKEFKISSTFKQPPKGVIIFDTYNNQWFPLKTVKIDNNAFNLRLVKDDFHRTYGGTNDLLFMPWHYTIEFVGKNYNVSLTRPIMYKSLIPGYENYISVCVIGDSNNDMYTKDMYKVIAHQVLNSIHYVPGWRLKVQDHLQYFTGDNFNQHLLEKELR